MAGSTPSLGNLFSLIDTRRSVSALGRILVTHAVQNTLFFFTELSAISLRKFPGTSGENLNIIVETAPHYKEIGTILLNDKRGNVVQGIAEEMRCTPERIMTRIYEKWLGKKVSWEDLIQCLKDCELYVVAEEIEDGLGNVSGNFLLSLLLKWCSDCPCYHIEIREDCEVLGLATTGKYCCCFSKTYDNF